MLHVLIAEWIFRQFGKLMKVFTISSNQNVEWLQSNLRITDRNRVDIASLELPLCLLILTKKEILKKCTNSFEF